MKRELLFLIFLVYIREIFSYKIGYINDKSMDANHQTTMRNSFNNFITKLNNQKIFTEQFTSYAVDYDVSSLSDDFGSIWSDMLNQKVVAVFSYCNFININQTKYYDVVGFNDTMLWCGCEDLSSICLKNVVFYSSSKAVMYRYAEYILFHELDNKMLILKDGTPESEYYYTYFAEVLELYGFTDYENMTITSTITEADIKTKIDALGAHDDIINLVKQGAQADKVIAAATTSSSSASIYHSPLLHELKNTVTLNSVTHYHLLAYVTTENVNKEIKNYFTGSDKLEEHHLYQLLVMMEVYSKVLNTVKSVEYESIITGLLNKELETFNNETNIKIRNDFHGDVNYFIVKYTNTPSFNIEIIYTMLYNWFDPYYHYGKPNAEAIGCNNLYGIMDRQSYTDDTVILFYGDLKYSSTDSNDDIMALMLLWSELSSLIKSNMLNNVEMIITNKNSNNVINTYKATRGLNIVIMMLKNTIKEKVLNSI